jgi:hypothetical protein
MQPLQATAPVLQRAGHHGRSDGQATAQSLLALQRTAVGSGHRAPLPSMEAWSIVWVWSTPLTLRQHARRLRNIAAAVEEFQ